MGPAHEDTHGKNSPERSVPRRRQRRPGIPSAAFAFGSEGAAWK